MPRGGKGKTEASLAPTAELPLIFAFHTYGCMGSVLGLVGVGCKDLGECFAGQAQVFGDRGKCFLQGGVSVWKCFQWCEREA